MFAKKEFYFQMSVFGKYLFILYNKKIRGFADQKNGMPLKALFLKCSECHKVHTSV